MELSFANGVQEYTVHGIIADELGLACLRRDRRSEL